MSVDASSSRLTFRAYGARRRPRLHVEFRAASRRRGVLANVDTVALSAGVERRRQEPSEEDPSETGSAKSYDLEFALGSVSATIASEAATGALVNVGDEEARASDLEDRIAKALDRDFATWLGEARLTGPEDRVHLVRLIKALAKKSGKSRQVLLTHMLDITLDPLTWRTVLEDVGPRPTVDVVLFLPGSLAHATTTEPLRDIDIATVYRGVYRAADDVPELAEAMTPDIAVPSPPIVLQARRNAEARTRLLTEFGALTAAQVAELAGSEARNTSALAGRWRREGRILAVDHHGTTYYPSFQFDAEGRPKAVVADVLKRLNSPEITPWQQALWFTTANGWLNGRRPVDLLDDEPQAVLAAATESFREPVG
jgi:hypothetical protein